MSTLHVFSTLALWYVPGFLAAHHMSRHGHDALPWVFAAWIGGVLLVPVAIGWRVWRRHVDHTDDEVVIDLTGSPSHFPREKTVHR